MPANSNRTNEVILEPFDPEGIGDCYLQFSCQYCQTAIQVTRMDQEQLACGGLGYKCQKCETYYALVRCPLCLETIGFDDVEWELLKKPDGYKCPKCNKTLIVSETNGPIMGSSGILAPNLREWSGDLREKSYVRSIKKSLNDTLLFDLALYHRTVGDRLESSTQSFDYIENIRIMTSMVHSNVGHSIPQAKLKDNEVTASSPSLNNEIFNFINCLRSCLDIVSHELRIIYKPEKSESGIDIKKIVGIIQSCPDISVQVLDHIEQYLSSDNYHYLNNFRNTIQHNRITLYQEIGSFNTGQLNSIKPVAIRSIAKVLLPDNPKVKYPATTYKNSKELRETLKSLKISVFEFVMGLYEMVGTNKSGIE